MRIPISFHGSKKINDEGSITVIVFLILFAILLSLNAGLSMLSAEYNNLIKQYNVEQVEISTYEVN